MAADAVALPAVPRLALAQSYPARPVRIVIGQPPGTAPDTLARLLARLLSERLGQSFIVENRPGAGTNIATEAVVRAAAKANPGKINMASAGSGTAPHVFGELFKQMAGIDLVHVQYRGSFYPDLFAGRVQVAFISIAGAIANIRDGKLRALAVSTARRSELLPDVPPMDEFVPSYEASAWLGIGAPHNSPSEIIATLNREINAITADRAIKARLVGLGVEPMAMTPAEFGKFTSDEAAKWSKVIKSAKIKAE